MHDYYVRGPHRGWVIAAFFLSVAALGMEILFAVCGSLFFDPLPDAYHIAAYVFLTGMLLFNDYVLKGNRAAGLLHRFGERRLLAAALVLTPAALFVAGAASIMLLMLTPMLLIGILFLGIGLLGFSPAFNLCVLTAQFLALRENAHGERAIPVSVTLTSLLCAGAGLVWFVARPIAIGHFLPVAVGRGLESERAVTWLRRLRAEPEALRLAYRKPATFWVNVGMGSRERAGDLYSSYWAPNEFRQWDKPSRQARRLYYLMTGRSFERVRPPLIVQRQGFWQGGSDDMAIEETGGEAVGTRAPGLSLAYSRMDGALDPRSETASCEWTLIFRNDSLTAREARTEILLPEGGVVDRVSLWINGEERPAAFGAKGAVREAYQSVAVVQQRDPLLVTAADTGHVLAQCFPVPARGEMKIRLGVSAPLVWRDAKSPRLTFTPPALQEVNFALPPALRHEIHLRERGSPAQGRWKGRGWSIEADDGGRSARLSLPASSLPGPQTLALTGGRLPRIGDRLSPEMVRRSSPFPHPGKPVDLLVLVDSTAGMDTALDSARQKEIIAALASLPAGSAMWTPVKEQRRQLPGSTRQMPPPATGGRDGGMRAVWTPRPPWAQR